MANGIEETQQAWQELLATLHEAEHSFLSPDKNLGASSQLQGYRNLLDTFSYAMDCYLGSDPLRPAFVPLAMPTRKMLGDNVDSVYYFSQIRGDQAYSIRGQRGDACYLGFTVYAGKPDGEWSERIELSINHCDIIFANDGTFEIILTPDEPRGANTFQLTADCVCVISREYYFNRVHDQHASFAIYNLTPVPEPLPETDSELARRLRAAATFVRQCTAVVPLAMPAEPNVLFPPFAFQKNQPSWGTVDNIYALGMFRLADDEVLVIEGRSPPCAYWGVQTWNNFMQSFDYRYHQVSRNAKQVAYNPDGSWTIHVSPVDPGFGNWVGTAGHNEGIIFCRWLLAGQMPEPPVTRVVKRAELVSSHS